jgi:hypothetical protein
MSWVCVFVFFADEMLTNDLKLVWITRVGFRALCAYCELASRWIDTPFPCEVFYDGWTLSPADGLMSKARAAAVARPGYG